MSWTSGLNSSSYAADLLSRLHGFHSNKEIKAAARAISVLARNSLGLLQQAYSGPPELSFLPLYYAILNLSKIYIVAAGKRAELNRNRWHGATYDPAAKASQDLLNENVVLKPRGILPLFYETLTSQSLGTLDRKMMLSDVVPYLRGVTFEYVQAYHKAPPFQPIRITIEQVASAKYRLRAILEESDHPKSGELRYLKVITGFRPDTQNQRHYLSATVQASSVEDARSRLVSNVRRFLLYDTEVSPFGPDSTWTPRSNRQLLMVEEIPIWITFFYLSNIVRYKPEFLDRLKDSRAWPMLLGLRKHSVLRFLVLFWSYMQKTEYHIRAE